MNENKCNICSKAFPENRLITGHGILHEIEDLIRQEHPEWIDNSRICKNDFNIFRVKYLTKIVEEKKESIETL